MPLLFLLACCTRGIKAPLHLTAAHWTKVQNSHFEVDSQSGAVSAQETLRWFERLRAFFQDSGLLPETAGAAPLHIVCFRSQSDYAEYRPRAIADAAYFSILDGEYILMAPLGSSASSIAAHEYAHYVLHANLLSLPAWLNEGLAEFFSTLSLTASDYQLGGDLPSRTQTLRHSRWIPISQLLQIKDSAGIPDSRSDAAVFYAESWALTNLLLTAPPYRDHFPQFISELNSGTDSIHALQHTYLQSPDALGHQLEHWSLRASSTRGVLLRHPESPADAVSELTPVQSSELRAELARVTGHAELAQVRYLELSRQQPDNPNYLAALGVISLQLGHHDDARNYWAKAIGKGTTDATLCYRYAVLAEEAGLDLEIRKAALERAIALSPHFDDALFQLAMVDSQSADYESVVKHLKAMRVPQGSRRYGYWSTLANALTELDPPAAVDAANQALAAAQNDNDRRQAQRAAYIASTDLTVQFSTDAEGRSRMVTTRVPHGTRNWNPFIEPGDHIQRVTAPLGAVLCTEGKFTGFLLRSSTGPLTLQVPDPLHVLIRNGPSEFYCGPAKAEVVTADFAVVHQNAATTNLLRGMDFQPPSPPIP